MRLATGEKGLPRCVSPYIAKRAVIEDRPSEPAVVEKKSARLDHIDGNFKTSRKPQQCPSILWYVRLEQCETQTILRFLSYPATA